MYNFHLLIIEFQMVYHNDDMDLILWNISNKMMNQKYQLFGYGQWIHLPKRIALKEFKFILKKFKKSQIFLIRTCMFDFVQKNLIFQMNFHHQFLLV